MRQEGIDFNRADLSINQPWPGMITGEWHNNHHLYPNGIRAGFLPYQWDYAWLFICGCRLFGGIKSYRDYKVQFMEKHYQPYLAQKNAVPAAKPAVSKPPPGPGAPNAQLVFGWFAISPSLLSPGTRLGVSLKFLSITRLREKAVGPR